MSSTLAKFAKFTDNVSLDHNLEEHIWLAVNRKNPSIQQNVKNYNDLCKEIVNLIKHDVSLWNKAPPVPINPDTLYSAQMDKNIWQDCRLDNEESGEIPAWLADEGVREGIRLMLALDRCNKERVQLIDKCCLLQEWFMEEWACVVAAKATASECVHIHWQSSHSDSF